MANNTGENVQLLIKHVLGYVSAIDLVSFCCCLTLQSLVWTYNDVTRYFTQIDGRSFDPAALQRTCSVSLVKRVLDSERQTTWKWTSSVESRKARVT